eukprot:jgi/Ulvmu1/5908/UM026_0030.1
MASLQSTLLIDGDDDDDDVNEHVNQAFERQYLDERSWESLVEKDGRLVSVQAAAVHRKRNRASTLASRVRRGMIRYMQLVLDMSSVCAASTDMRPNRAVSLAQLAQAFISEFFDQNPLSQMSVVVMRQGCAHVLTDLSASPEVHKNAIKSALETGGEVSLQNMLAQCTQTASLVPPYGMREALVLLSSLTTADPGNISDAIKAAQKAKLRVSIIGLSAEMYISNRISSDTLGVYSVATSEEHLRDLVMGACAPPAVECTVVEPKLVRMAFPAHDAKGARFATFVGEGCSIIGGAYTCPVCASKNDSIPGECHVCRVTLISSAHLARSYHHLFPIASFHDISLYNVGSENHSSCNFCGSGWTDEVQAGEQPVYQCAVCNCVCCDACDDFIHEHLHNCPGCEMLQSRR